MKYELKDIGTWIQLDKGQEVVYKHFFATPDYLLVERNEDFFKGKLRLSTPALLVAINQYQGEEWIEVQLPTLGVGRSDVIMVKNMDMEIDTRAEDKIIQMIDEMKIIPKNVREANSLKIKAQNEILNSLKERIIYGRKIPDGYLSQADERLRLARLRHSDASVQRSV